MTPTPALVHLVDDDPGILRALGRLLKAEGYAVCCHSSPQSFLQAYRPDQVACAVLDVAMPELSGLDLQQELGRTGQRIPLVFLTGRGDIPMSVSAIKEGAVDFLTKPVEDAILLQAVRTALELAVQWQASRHASSIFAHRVSQLTPREKEVLQHVISGKLNKQIAADLNVGEQTIKIHRSRAMKKLGLFSVADLVRAAERLGWPQLPSDC